MKKIFWLLAIFGLLIPQSFALNLSDELVEHEKFIYNQLQKTTLSNKEKLEFVTPYYYTPKNNKVAKVHLLLIQKYNQMKQKTLKKSVVSNQDIKNYVNLKNSMYDFIYQVDNKISKSKAKKYFEQFWKDYNNVFKSVK